MLFKNHVKVDITKEPIYEKYKADFEAKTNNKNVVVVKTHDKVIINKTGNVEPPRCQTVPVKSIITSADGFGEDLWVYCDKAPKVNQKGEYEYDLDPIEIWRDVSIPTSKKDKLFFLMYLSTAAKNGRTYVVNDKLERLTAVEKINAKSRVDFLLTDEFSPLTEHRMRLIAKSFGIANVDEKDKEEVILALRGVVNVSDSKGDTTRNTNAFIDAMRSDKIVDTKAIVQEAIDEGKIKYDDKQLFYYYASQDGTFAKKIVTVDTISASGEASRLAILHKYYLDNEQSKGELQRLLGYETTVVDFSKVEWNALRKFAKQHDIDARGKMEELVERITNIYNETKETKKYDLTLLSIEVDE